jgi:hypothetical protein
VTATEAEADDKFPLDRILGPTIGFPFAGKLWPPGAAGTLILSRRHFDARHESLNQSLWSAKNKI